MQSYSGFINKLFNLGAQEAGKLGHKIVGSEHILIAISRQGDCIANRILLSRNLNTEKILEIVMKKLGLGPINYSILTYSTEIKSIFDHSIEISKQLGFDFLGAEHVLISILQHECGAKDILTENGITIQEVTSYVLLAKSNMKEEKRANNIENKYLYQEKIDQGLNQIFNANIDSELILEDTLFDIRETSDQINQKEEFKKKFPYSSEYLTDISTQTNKENRIYGREQELQRVYQILIRKNKNNPILTGQSGIGKKSIVHAFAQSINSNKVPTALRNKKILSFDISLLLSVTRYRDDLEEKFKKIIEELRENKEEYLIFIDQVHLLSVMRELSVEAGNIFRNALVRQDFQMIGVTDIQDYKKYMENDTVLNSQIQTIFIEEPSVEETIEIIKNIKENYERHHGVIINDTAIKCAVEMSKRYINTKFLPDKAIDVIDEAASKIRLGRISDYKDFLEIKEKIKAVEKNVKRYISMNDAKNAVIAKNELIKLDMKLKSIKQNYNQIEVDNINEICRNDIASVISQMRGIPLEKLLPDESEKLLNMEQDLGKEVIGQDHAIKSVTKAIQRARTGLRDPNKPIGSFIFVGPTGVGKTQLSKSIAKFIFDDEDAIIRVDMSEYMEKHSVSKIIGSPPGYVGYSDGGQLTEKIKMNPYSVVLFDEIEKAHPDVFNILLQVLDEGTLTDSQGVKVDFKNTIIIMTSNIGASNVNKTSFGFTANLDKENQKEDKYEKIKEKFLDELKKSFKPEFLNRIDEVIVFRQLEEEDIEQIVKIMLSKLQKRLEEKRIYLKMHKSAIKAISENGYNPEYGARPLQRSIQKMVENILAEKILKREIIEKDRVLVTGKNEILNFKVLDKDD